MKNFYLFLLLTFISITGLAKTTTWIGSASASWNVATNWDNGIPVAGDIVIFPTNTTSVVTQVAQSGNIILASLLIQGNSTITLQAAAARVLTISNGAAGDDLAIDAGAQLTLSTNVNLAMGANANASIDGQLNVQTGRTYNTDAAFAVTTVTSTGIINNNGGTVTSSQVIKLLFNSGATYIHARNAGAIPTATWNAASNLNITGITATAPTNLSQTFGNVKWDNAQTADINLNGVLTTIAGNLEIVKTSANATVRQLEFKENGPLTILNVTGNLIIQQTAPATTNVVLLDEGTGSITLNITGNYNHKSGNLVFADVNSDGDNGTTIVNLNGNFLQEGGDVDFTSGDEGPAGRRAFLNLKGNLTQTAGTIRTTVIDDAVINGLITFNKAGEQIYTATTPTNITYTNFTVANGSTLRLASGLRISRDNLPNFVGKLIVEDGGVLNTATFVVSSQIEGDVPAPETAFAEFQLLPGGKLITGSANGVQGAINTGNNLTATFSSAADYEFRGAATGTFATSPTANTARNFIVNNSTTSNVTLSQPMLVTGALTLANGYLTTTTNLLTVGTGGTATTANGAFVNGPLAKNTNSATIFNFPVGKAAGGLRTVGIITTAATVSTFTAEFFRATPPTGALAPTLTRISGCEYWTLERPSGAAAQVVLSWSANSPCTPGGGYVTQPSTLKVAHLVGGTWLNEGGVNPTGNNTAGTITSANAVSAFSPFALASSNAANPLPVIFANVRVIEKDNGVEIGWSNLTERDVLSYSVERSTNGRDFTMIAQQQAISNANDKADYLAFDAAPMTGVNYYRIRVEEIGGKVTYTRILSVNLKNNVLSLQLYPNPVIGKQVTVSLANLRRGQYYLKVVSSSGQQVFTQTINSISSKITQVIDLPASLKTGAYNMIVTGDGFNESKIFIVQ
ncbi:T9SS type A sorting domain-containing protein [Terrimonas pollutisoli]|uniref:T9SS type A sorting domain-containing protein n=1 Tax=Terrimonas pollutisoli TaxID=3034147 RepID=UPI0023EE067F|nr:T9SS type A sorting domain-containing protein [Terrimonas sp. H1YJ31]